MAFKIKKKNKPGILKIKFTVELDIHISINLLMFQKFSVNDTFVKTILSSAKCLWPLYSEI